MVRAEKEQEEQERELRVKANERGRGLLVRWRTRELEGWTRRGCC